MDEIPYSKDLFDQLTLGVIQSLEKRPGICDISLADLKPSERHQVVSWEQNNACMLPDDLKRFYLTSDGLMLKWNVRFDDQVQQVGQMEVNSVSNLNKLAGKKASSNTNTPSLADVDYNSDEEEPSGEIPAKPHFDTRSRIFELDPCRDTARVCLVYRNTKPGTPAQHPDIWLLDRALRWHFLAHTFSQYFRMMLKHLGLPQWQYVFTDIGLSPQAKQWFAIYSPLRIKGGAELGSLEISPLTDRSPGSQPAKTSSSDHNKLDPGRIFKVKTDKKTKSSQNKKKVGAAGKPLSSGSSNRSGSQLGGSRPRRDYQER